MEEGFSNTNTGIVIRRAFINAVETLILCNSVPSCLAFYSKRIRE
jgi:hypothetical protein